MSAMPTLIPPPSVPVATPRIETPQRFVLEGVTWEQYELFGQACQDRAGLRLNYDGWSLELRSTSPLHEGLKSLLGTLLFVLFDELSVDHRALGNTTWRRQVAQAGLEPDVCFYIQSLPSVQGVVNPDLNRHPPPDLAIEVEVSHSVLDRLSIYARLRVPEIWRASANAITVLRLQANGQYAAHPASVCVPLAPLAELARVLGQVAQSSDLTLARQFRDWLRQNVPTTPSTP